MISLLGKLICKTKDSSLRKFVVVVLGEHYYIKVDDKTGNFAFYASRMVEARTPQGAIDNTIEIVSNQIKKHVISDNDKQLITLHKIVEVKRFNQQDFRESFVFFSHDDSSDDVVHASTLEKQPATATGG